MLCLLKTFQFLIKHAARAGHAIFARHYLVQAMRLDREEDVRLRRDLCTLPVHEISPPLVAVNRRMFLSVFGLSNIQKHAELMRWTKRLTRYGQGAAGGGVSSGAMESRKASVQSQANASVTGLVQETSTSSSADRSSTTPPNFSPSNTRHDPLPESSGAVGTSSSSSIPTPTPSVTPSSEHPGGTSGSSIFDLDINSDCSHSPPPRRVFDIDAHISLLQRDIRQLEQLGYDVEAVLGRTVHRVKERLGRRVWSGKNIWLAQDQARVPATKEFWKGAVNFVVPNVTKYLRTRGGRQTRPKRS